MRNPGLYETTDSYSVIQTFYVDRENLGNAETIRLTSVDLFFKQKPSAIKNVSGSSNPSVTIAICEVGNDQPILSETLIDSKVTLSLTSINASSADPSIATKFSFESPLLLSTDRFYGLVVIFSDPAFELWVNKQGDNIFGTSIRSSGSNSLKDGKLYKTNNSNIFRAVTDTDLKFTVRAARYTSASVTAELVNDDYEFFRIKDRVGSFRGGETVYANVTNAEGTLDVTRNRLVIGTSGTNTDQYGIGSKIAVISGNVSQVLTINSANSSSISVDRPPSFTNATADFKVTVVGEVYFNDNISPVLILTNSSASNTFPFAANTEVVGEVSSAKATIVSIDEYEVDQFVPRIRTDVPSNSRVTGSYVLATSNGTAFSLDPSKTKPLKFNALNQVERYRGTLASRSLEVSNPNLHGSSRKSALATVQLTNPSSNSFSSPSLSVNELDFFIQRNRISSDRLSTDANSVVFDTETTNAGLAKARYVSRKFGFANNRFAEDIRVIISAYRPLGTDIHVYAKVHNSVDSEHFDDKAWTPLTIIENANKFSSTENSNDLVEFQYGFSQAPESAVTLPGTFTAQLSNNVIVATDDPTSLIANGNLIVLYSALIPTSYVVAVVASANTTALTLQEPISNNNVVGSGFKVDRLKYYHTAFNNKFNDGIVRYFNDDMVPFDTYDSIQVKVVLTSNSTNVVPAVETLQAIAVSV